ncbi:GIY-YIG nuclease family protein [Niabella pedocola]|uniref:GIY-YIG nuclease family protein n=1 Tax=Niabella pedocola TaxID=1752077 RepID=UPI00374D580F
MRFFYFNPGTTLPYFVYILQSGKDASFYIGQCNDLDRRMAKHFDDLNSLSFKLQTSNLKPTAPVGCFFEPDILPILGKFFRIC